MEADAESTGETPESAETGGTARIPGARPYGEVRAVRVPGTSCRARVRRPWPRPHLLVADSGPTACRPLAPISDTRKLDLPKQPRGGLGGYRELPGVAAESPLDGSGAGPGRLEGRSTGRAPIVSSGPSALCRTDRTWHSPPCGLPAFGDRAETRAPGLCLGPLLLHWGDAMKTDRAIVLSDLHLGPGGPLTTFREGRALAGLLEHLAADERSTELVLAGDTFDFLQIEGYSGFDATAGASRFEALCSHADTEIALRALARFAARPRNEITILAGNHDPELLLPDVRRQLEERIGRRGTVRWTDDEPLLPREDERPGLSGRELRVGDRAAWVVHGDAWDPHNAYDRQTVAGAISRGLSVALPAGSHLVFEVLSKMKPDQRWVDELKPEMPAVLLLLLYIEPRRTAGYLKDHFGITARLLRGLVEAAALRGPVMGRVENGDHPSDQPLGRWLGEQLGQSIREQTPDRGRRELLAATLQERMEHCVPAEGTLAGHGGLWKVLLRAWLRAIRSTERFGALDGPDPIPDAADPLLPPHVTALVAGHTHGPRLRPGGLCYVNTGTWLPVAKLPPGDLKTAIDALERGERWPAEAPRTAALIEARGGELAVELLRCDEDGAPSGGVR